MTRQIKIFILLSLLLNVLLGGVVIGHVVKREDWRDPVAEEFVASLAPGRRAELAPLLDDMQRNKERWKTIRPLKEKALIILSAKEFDANAYDKATDAIADFVESQHEARSDVVVKLAEKLTQAERVKLADALRQPPRWSNQTDDKTGCANMTKK